MRSTEKSLQSNVIIYYIEICRNVLTFPKKEFTLISGRTNVRENVLCERGIVL